MAATKSTRKIYKTRRVNATRRRQQRGGDLITWVKGKTVALLEYAGINLTDERALKEKIAAVNRSLADPQVQAELQTLTTRLGEKARVVIKAAEPAIIEFLNSSGSVMQKTLPKLIDDMTAIALNTAQAVPGLGILIGLLRDIDRGISAAQSASAAAADVTTAASKAISDTVARIEDPIGTASEGHIGGPIGTASGDPIGTQPKLDPATIGAQLGGGGGRRADIARQIGGSIRAFQATNKV
jgi:hypothetical protein